jgi:hypothetical protein
VGGQVVKLWTYEQLEFLTQAKLKQRALNLRDQVASEIVCPRIPQDTDSLIRWILDLQTKLSGHTAKEFGAPSSVYQRVRDRSPFRLRQETKHPHLYRGDSRMAEPTLPPPSRPVSHTNPSWARDHMVNNGVGMQDEPVHGMKHNSHDNWARDHINRAATPEDNQAQSSQGMRHARACDNWTQDHMRDTASATQVEAVHGMKHNTQDNWTTDHIRRTASPSQDEPVHGRKHDNADEWTRDHMVNNGMGAQNEPIHGRMHDTRDNWTRDHLSKAVTVNQQEPAHGRKHDNQDSWTQDHIGNNSNPGDRQKPRGQRHYQVY